MPFAAFAHGELDLDDDDDAPEKGEEEKAQIDATVAAVKEALGDRVSDVRTTNRLTETASCLVARSGDPGANLERIMKMLDETAVERKRILEINPKHPFVLNLSKQISADAKSPRVKLWSEMLFDQALLSEGVIEDPAKLVKRIQQLLVESSTAAVGETAPE